MKPHSPNLSRVTLECWAELIAAVGRMNPDRCFYGDRAMHLTEILSKYHVPFKRPEEDRHVTDGWIGVRCPFCVSTSFHLGLHPVQGRANCWRCGSKWIVEVVAEVCRIPVTQSARLLKQSTAEPYLLQQREYDNILRKPKGLEDLTGRHRSYLRTRGFDPHAICRLWRVKALALTATLKWRLFIPIFDHFGNEVSWTTRSIGDTNPQRYISAKREEERIHHKHILYGGNLARNSIIIVEGPLDAWAIGPGAVATMGLSYTSPQLERMLHFPRRIVCFDSTDAAQMRARTLCRALSAFGGYVENITLETGSDPADADEEEIEEIRREFLN